MPGDDLDTFYASSECRVFRQPVNLNFAAAYKAVAVLACFNAAKGTLNLSEFPPTQPGWFLGSNLRMHRIHTGKAGESRFIQLHCRFLG